MSNKGKSVNILFVCLGNICRSPAAEAILKEMAKQSKDVNIQVQSCGLGSWHVGQLPDSRMQTAAQRRGLIMTSKAQQFKPEFFDQYDYILAVDHEVLHSLYQYARSTDQKSKVHLLTEFSKSYPREEIPDPYYGNEGAFDLVLDMLEDSCQGLIKTIQKK